MKTKTSKISLKKLTIARINPTTLNMVNGGSSIPTEPSIADRFFGGHCK